MESPWYGCSARFVLWDIQGLFPSKLRSSVLTSCFRALVCFALIHVGHVSRIVDTDEKAGNPFIAFPALYKYSLQGCPSRWCHRSFSVRFLIYIAVLS